MSIDPALSMPHPTLVSFDDIVAFSRHVLDNELDAGLRKQFKGKLASFYLGGLALANPEVELVQFGAAMGMVDAPQGAKSEVVMADQSLYCVRYQARLMLPEGEIDPEYPRTRMFSRLRTQLAGTMPSLLQYEYRPKLLPERIVRKGQDHPGDTSIGSMLRARFVELRRVHLSARLLDAATPTAAALPRPRL